MYPLKQKIILKLKEAGGLYAEVYTFNQKLFLKLKEFKNTFKVD